MFGRLGPLAVLAAYAVILLVVGTTARLAFIYYRHDRNAPAPTVLAPGPEVVSSSGMPGATPIHYDYAAVAAANQRLALLQANLERTTAQLRKKNELLNQRNAECRSLEQKLDESVAFAMELLVQEPGADREAQTRDVKAKLEADLGSLRRQLRESQLLSAAYTERLDALRLDLMQADLEIANLREQARLEIATLMDERRAVEAAASGALVQLGEPAVPPLITLLRNPQPEVRRWSATVLGNLGLNAMAAIEPLNSLANDPDPDVADAVRHALARIEP